MRLIGRTTTQRVLRNRRLGSILPVTSLRGQLSPFHHSADCTGRDACFLRGGGHTSPAAPDWSPPQKKINKPTQFRVAEPLNSCSVSSSVHSISLSLSGRHHVRPGRVRHQRGHHDPVRDGGGPQGEGHRGADDAAQLAVHGGEGHLQRRAQSRDRSPVSDRSTPPPPVARWSTCRVFFFLNLL